jgi:tyrosyl-tRNA synthetase
VTNIIDELSWRGLLAITTDLDTLRGALGSGQVTAYAGFDPTAPSLHIGHLVQLLTLRRLQVAGHRPIGLVGGATGLIGDPSGKSAERVLNSRDVVAEWTQRLRGQVEHILDFEAGPASALLVSNLDWTAELSALDFLREIGKHFSVNQMLARESVRARLEGGGISYTEFSYQLLQATDYLELHRRHGCTLQAGGSDQWGNLVAGVDLIRRVDGASVHAVATPLITKPDGTKYGKTEGAAVWLNPEMMSPYAFYQFLLNRADAEVGGLLRVFTFRTKDEIADLERATAERPAAREAQQVLAQDVTTLVHGTAEYEKAVAASRALFGQGDLGALDEKTLQDTMGEVPSATVPVEGWPGMSASRGLSASSELRAKGRTLTPADLMTLVGIVPSKSAARRAIAEGGAYLNNKKVTNENDILTGQDLLHGRFLVLRRGKRTVGVVEVVGEGAAGPPSSI